MAPETCDFGKDAYLYLSLIEHRWL